ncbi:hypothetical protein W911_11410 [Hyphomicrobium nitrativorans NL23]|uniref:LysM domain-containing protein n=1 Tax=Hyphomicrobium nitrativorans NL23 TaxID=1029756 RepID=V5SH51_9HYPH|nr:LysM peptidoglycan-binding domain-containing protein [Hyphomicrobium nitrativorans]AHB50216.1 hypothetical protein W911_11410 [Hyphomicrobium nitrativorans NL23]
MRFRSRPLYRGALAIAGLAATLAGCSSSGSQGSLTTSSLSPRPHENVYASPQRTYPDGSAYGRPYNAAPHRSAHAPRQYVDPGTPTPRHMADAGYRPASNGIQTASLGGSSRSGNATYDPNARWQQPSPFITGAGAPPRSAGAPPAAHTPPRPAGPHVVEVREGDTLYSISRHHRVPLHDIVVANRLTSDRIEVGQRIVVPTRTR